MQEVADEHGSVYYCQQNVIQTNALIWFLINDELFRLEVNMELPSSQTTQIGGASSASAEQVW